LLFHRLGGRRVNCIGISREAIRRNFGSVHDPRPQVGEECVGVVAVALADTV
jgi:hypothetical protein